MNYELFLAHPEVTTDSRHCPEGSMFFALRGDTFDGNRFAAQALEAGCAVAVVDDPAVIPEGDTRYVLVPDTLQALQQLAAEHRRHFQGPVIQVTGTNGKTTTKELLAAVLAMSRRVLYTQGNLNNHIGVPLTLLRLRPGEHDIAIIETGANHPGEIAALTQIVQPDYGLVTNVGRAHLEGFGSFEGVKRTKGELYDYLRQKPAPAIFVCQSNPDLCAMLAERGIAPDRCITYTSEQPSSSPASQLSTFNSQLSTFNSQLSTPPASQLSTPHPRGGILDANPLLSLWWTPGDDSRYEVQTNLIGDYNLDNVLAAIAVGLHFGIAPADICEALATYQPSLGRSEYRRTAHNELIIDAYNANLTSMMAALRNFRGISHPQKMVILGDMKELGADSADAHLRVAAEVIGSDVAVAWFVGENFTRALSQIPAPPDLCIRTFADVEAVKQHLQTELPQGTLILIKGSNSTRLHQLPALL